MGNRGAKNAINKGKEHIYEEPGFRPSNTNPLEETVLGMSPLARQKGPTAIPKLKAFNANATSRGTRSADIEQKTKEKDSKDEIFHEFTTSNDLPRPGDSQSLDVPKQTMPMATPRKSLLSNSSTSHHSKAKPPLGRAKQKTRRNSRATRSGGVHEKKDYRMLTGPPGKFGAPIAEMDEKFKMNKDKLLGTGVSGVVVLGTKIQPLAVSERPEVAVKTYSKCKMSDEEKFHARYEAEILMSFKHTNICKAYGYFEADDRMYLVMEKLIPDLLIEVQPLTDMKESFVRDVFLQMILCMKHCWARGIVHGDIKPGNLLLREKRYQNEIISKRTLENNIPIRDLGITNSGMPQGLRFGDLKNRYDVVICDFGGSVQVPPERHDEKDYIDTDMIMGTVLFCAPERLDPGYFSFKVDVFALGMVLYILLCGGDHPYDFEGDPKEKSDKFLINGIIRDNKLNFNKSVQWEEVSEPAKDLVQQLLATEPDDRPDYNNILQHKFFTSKAKDLSKRIISQAEMQRYNARRASDAASITRRMAPIRTQEYLLERKTLLQNEASARVKGNSDLVKECRSARAALGQVLSSTSAATPEYFNEEVRTSFRSDALMHTESMSPIHVEILEESALKSPFIDADV